MKKILTFIISALLVCFQYHVQAQVVDVCAGDGTDSVTLSVANYQYGQIQWQQSEDMEEWWDIYRAIDTTLRVLPKGHMYYRAKISFAGCPDDYSDTLHVQYDPSADAGFDRVLNVGERCRMRASLNSGERGVWTVLEGSDAVFGDVLNPKSSFLGTDTLYRLVWTVYNACGTSSDTIEVRYVETILYDAIVPVDTTDIILSDSLQMAEGYYEIVFNDPIPVITDTTILVSFRETSFLRKVVDFFYEGDTCHLFTDPATVDDVLLYGVIGIPDYIADDEFGSRSVGTSYINHLPTRAEIEAGLFDNNRTLMLGSVAALNNRQRDAEIGQDFGFTLNFGNFEFEAGVVTEGDIHFDNFNITNFDPVFCYYKFNSRERSDMFVGCEGDLGFDIVLNNFSIGAEGVFRIHLLPPLSVGNPTTTPSGSLPRWMTKIGKISFEYGPYVVIMLDGSFDAINGIIHHEGHFKYGSEKMLPIPILVPEYEGETENRVAINGGSVSLGLGAGLDANLECGGSTVFSVGVEGLAELEYCGTFDDDFPHVSQLKSKASCSIGGCVNLTLFPETFPSLGIEWGPSVKFDLSEAAVPQYIKPLTSLSNVPRLFSETDPTVTVQVQSLDGIKNRKGAVKEVWGPTVDIPQAVYFEASHGGTVSPSMQFTNGNGVASAVWTPNPNVEELQTLRATIYGCGPAPITQAPVKFYALKNINGGGPSDSICDGFTIREQPLRLNSDGTYTAIVRGVNNSSDFSLIHYQIEGEEQEHESIFPYTISNIPAGSTLVITATDENGCVSTSTITTPAAHDCFLDGPQIETQVVNDTITISSRNGG